MKKNRYHFFLFFFSLLIVSQLAFGEPSTIQDLRSFYETSIDKMLLKCEKKYCLKDSRSANLRKCAKRASSKAKFIQGHRDGLIADMIKQKVDPKGYKVEYYVNNRFSQTIGK